MSHSRYTPHLFLPVCTLQIPCVKIVMMMYLRKYINQNRHYRYRKNILYLLVRRLINYYARVSTTITHVRRLHTTAFGL